MNFVFIPAMYPLPFLFLVIQALLLAAVISGGGLPDNAPTLCRANHKKRCSNFGCRVQFNLA